MEKKKSGERLGKVGEGDASRNKGEINLSQSSHDYSRSFKLLLCLQLLSNCSVNAAGATFSSDLFFRLVYGYIVRRSDVRLVYKIKLLLRLCKEDCHANLLKRGTLRLLGPSLREGGEAHRDSRGGEDEGSESASEQKEPLLEESLDEELMKGRLLLDMLKYLSSWATAERISVLFSYWLLKDQASGPPALRPNMGSCLTGPAGFFSGVREGGDLTSSRA